MKWLAAAIRDGHSGTISTKRIVILIGALAMSATVLMLGVAALLGYDVGVALTGVCAPLAGVGGYGYVNGKRAERDLP